MRRLGISFLILFSLACLLAGCPVFTRGGEPSGAEPPAAEE